MQKSALRFKHTQVPRQQGELARLKVIQGPDYGAVYILMAQKATLGRGEENDIVISDLKASRVHAELTFQASKWFIQDQGSSNGILHNGKNVRQAVLKINDTLTVGESTLEFTTSDVGTMMLVAPPRSTEQFQSDLRNFDEQKKRVENIFGGNSSNQSNKNSHKSFLIYGVLGILVVFLVFSEGDSSKNPSQKKEKTQETERDLASYLPDTATSRTAETLFKEGQREYFAGNYNRARKQFETVLQISPGHSLATIYLQNCMKSVDEEVKVHLEYGKKSLVAGKLRDAHSHFDRVMRLLYRDQTNPSFIEAKEQAQKTDEAIKEGGTYQ